jgi:hypothetical protein
MKEEKGKQGHLPTQALAERRKKMGFKKIVFALPLAALLSLPVMARAEGPDPAALQGKVDGLDERMATAESDLAGLKKFKFSGYIQARYELHADSEDKYSIATQGATPSDKNKDYFYIRRGRLKLSYEGSKYYQAILQLDAAKASVSLKDAQGRLMLPLGKTLLTLDMGQFKWPFGWEMLRSSSEREMPERTKACGALMPGERDRGIMFGINAPKYVQFNMGLFNGYGTGDSGFPVITPVREAALVSRLALDFGFLTLGGSAFAGSSSNRPSTAVGTTEYNTRAKNRFGTDLHVYYAIPVVGGGRVDLEGYSGKDWNTSKNNKYASSLGGYVQLVQNFLKSQQLAVRYDYWDPDTDVDLDGINTLAFALSYFFAYDPNAKITVAYDIPVHTNKGKDKDDDFLTMQIQYKF